MMMSAGEAALLSTSRVEAADLESMSKRLEAAQESEAAHRGRADSFDERAYAAKQKEKFDNLRT